MADGGRGSTLHPSLRSVHDRAALADAWRDGGAMRLAPVLDPGFAAELLVVLGRIRLEPRILASQSDLSWSADVSLPTDPDPQHPRALLRLVRFLRADLPELVASITGRRLANGEPQLAHLWSMQKGSFVDAGAPLAPPGGVEAWLGLTGGSWPAEWGGQPVWTSARGVSFALPPAVDCLDLLDGGAFQVPLLTRHVHSLTVRTFLVPTAEGP